MKKHVIIVMAATLAVLSAGGCAAVGKGKGKGKAPAPAPIAEPLVRKG